jgi:hypothetical protein
MSANLPTGTNERRKQITYKIKDLRTGSLMHELRAGKFSATMIKRECARLGLALPVSVEWTVLNRWGWNMQQRRVE